MNEHPRMAFLFFYICVFGGLPPMNSQEQQLPNSTLALLPLLNYNIQPETKWESQSYGRVETEVRVTPLGDLVLSLGNDCQVTSFSVDDGTEVWTYAPTNTSDCVTNSLLFGATANNTDYVAFPVASEDDKNHSRIVGIDLSTGNEIFSIGTILGKVAGAPVRSSDNRYLLVTHHESTARTSYFTVWDIQESRIVYAYDRLGSPFSPLGVYWNPVQGYYDDGFENTNDIFVWSLDLEEDITDPSGGLVFVFQFPAPTGGPLRVVTVGDERQFRSPHAPLLTNGGLNMYMAISRNDIRCWAGEKDLRRYAFHTGGIGRVDFPRSEVDISASPPAPPSVSEFTGAIYGPTATGEIYRLNANCSQNVTIPTIQVVQSKVLVDHEYVYYATQAPAATLYQLDHETLDITWQFPLDRGVVADMALSADGKTIFLSDIAGLVRAVTIAVPSAPTPAPPPTVPTIDPTESPTVTPTKSPAPSSAPTPAVPTTSPQPTTETQPSPTPSPSVNTNPTAPTTSVVSPNDDDSSKSSRHTADFLLPTLFVGWVWLF